MGAALLAVTLYYAASRAYLWNQERRLITRGQRVEAEVMHWEKGGAAPANKVLPPDANVDLAYTYQGNHYRVYGALAGRTEQIYTRRKVPIFIDPALPTRWTGRTKPANFAHELLGAMLLAPFVVVLFALAVWWRGRVLRTFREGEGMLAEVVEIRNAAAAPGSRLVHCALHLGEDARIVKTLLPARRTPPVGQGVWLIVPPNRPQEAIPAALFD